VAGRRTRAKGYVPAPFIADGKIVASVGGGVSQFATTMFNAAYFAGLQLDAHQPHSIYIDRYPPGREATLDYDSIDLRWTNDTAGPVLVRASSTPTSVTVALYGDNGGRRVRARSGPRSAVPGRAFAVTVTRIVRYADGRVVRQPYTTTYDQPPSDD
jgi:vancomycin resistance protein YoaR